MRNMNHELGLRAPSRWSNMADERPMDPIEPEFQDAAIDIENIADETTRDVVATATDLAGDAVVKGKEIGSLALGEGERALGALSRSTQRLDGQPRVFGFIPNSLLIYGLIGLGAYLLIKK